MSRCRGRGPIHFSYKTLTLILFHLVQKAMKTEKLSFLTGIIIYGLTNPPFLPLLASIKLDEDWAGLSMPFMSIPGVYPGGMGKAPGLCGGAFGPFLERFGTPGWPLAAARAIAPRPKNWPPSLWGCCGMADKEAMLGRPTDGCLCKDWGRGSESSVLTITDVSALFFCARRARFFFFFSISSNKEFDGVLLLVPWPPLLSSRPRSVSRSRLRSR